MAEIEGKSIVVSVAPTLDTNIYADGDQMCSGSILLDEVLDNTKGTGAVLSVTVIDKDKEAAPFDILFFNSDPTIVSSNNAALDISDSEMASKFLGRIEIASADYSNLANCSVATISQVGLLLQGSATSRDLYIVLQCRGTPTYTASSDLQIKIGILLD